jgi:sulfate adenylyltransferase subunit 2
VHCGRCRQIRLKVLPGSVRNQPPSDRGTRRDEEAIRAKERIVSVRSASHGWEPRAQRPVVMRDGLRIVVDDPARMRWRPGEEASRETVRFRTLGCWPVTAAEPSQAATLTDVVAETLKEKASERRGRIGDAGSL